MSDSPCKKIDIFLDGRYACSTMQARTIKQAIDNFKKNPTWQGLRADGTLGVCTASYWSVSAWWSARP